MTPLTQRDGSARIRGLHRRNGGRAFTLPYGWLPENHQANHLEIA